MYLFATPFGTVPSTLRVRPGESPPPPPSVRHSVLQIIHRCVYSGEEPDHVAMLLLKEVADKLAYDYL